MSGLSPILLSLAVLADFALAFGGVRLILRGRDRIKGVLMLIAALVILGNILLWSLPLPSSPRP
ncbi:hypothetical protein [Sphingomonas bacterium]|uniref:hypothetical protein n=1 Tax=Sphingomonas bacterium TaxID=1895847 RepID=UPI0015755A81|nr:hypothetical protein [Sphingomonas bacterium]